MKHIIRLFILIAALVLGTDHAWADTDSNPRVNFVYVDGDNYALTSDKGFAFASDETTGEVTITVKIFDGQDYRCINGDLTAEQSINSGNAEARTRTSGEGLGKGVPVPVIFEDTNEFTLTLPEDESTNVTVYVKFSEKLEFNPEVTIEDWPYGETANEPSLKANPSSDDVTYTYADAEEGTYTETVPTQAGPHWVKASVAATADYKACESQPVSFTIAKAPLTIKAKDHGILYGNAAANNGVEYSGFVNNEDESVLGGELTYTYSYDANNDNHKPGIYEITPSGLTSGNYAITFVPGTLTVNSFIVKVSVVDKATREPIVGNQVEVRNSNGVIIHDWRSTSTEDNHEISVLKAGGEYTIIGNAYLGYTRSAEYTLTIGENGNVSSYSGTITQDGVLLVENSKTHVNISVVDKVTRAALGGARVQVKDSKGTPVDEWDSGTENNEINHIIECLTIYEVYTLCETVAPNGYAAPAACTFTIDETGKVTTTDGTTTTDEEGNTVLLLENRRKLTHMGITVAGIADHAWTGSAITPDVVVKDGEMDITDLCDISYSDNTDAGQATITITAKDGSDYAGSTTVHFLIYKTANTYYVDADGTRHDNIPAIVLSGYENSLNEGTYLVESDINVDHQIDLYGNVTIILGDGAKMNISDNPIYGGSSAMLTIYGQTQHGGEMIFSCNNSNIDCLEVGGGITINSGTVYVRTEYSDCQGIHTNGDLTINGGTIDINVTDAAIYAGGTVRINGGQVTAISTGNGIYSYGIYSANSDIILGYANASDFVNASSYRTDINKGYIARIKDGLMMRNHSDIYDKYNSMAAYNNGICQFNGIKLEPVPCTVTFDIEVEGNAPESQTVLYGFYATEPTAPTREGYDFAGWKNGEDDYDFATPVAGDLTLTANWEIIHFEKDGITYEWTSASTVKVAECNSPATSLVIPASVDHKGVSYNVKEIGVEAFMNSNLTELYLTNCTITVIEARAFKGCTNLSKIYDLPASLTTIEKEAFSGCNLTEFTIPDGLTSIGQRAFADCPSLTSVTIPASVTNISDDAFEGCSENLIIYVTDGLVESYQKRWPNYIILPEGAVPYIDADGNTAYCTNFTVLTGSTDGVTLGSDGETTWYVVNSNVDYKQIELVGDVHLILCDGKKMTAISGSASAIMGGNSLTIYGQTAGTGKLETMCGEGSAICSNAITINGGTVNAIGGDTTDDYGIFASGNVTINGGNVSASGNFSDSYGIFASGDVTINGGNVSATGNSGGIMARGNIILGWTNNTDRIYASSFSADGTISIANGKAFTDGTNVYTSATPSATLEALTNVTLRPVTGVTLTDDGEGKLTATLDPSSEEEVNIPVPVEVDHVNVDRIYVAGKASTVYLPFSIAYDKVTGGKFHTFTGVDETTDPWEVQYTEVTSGAIAANTPYIFLPDGTNSGKIVVNNGTEKISVCTANPQTTTQGQWEFIGTDERIKWTSNTSDQEWTQERENELGNVYGFAAFDTHDAVVGQFVKATSGAYINPMRAYLKHTPSSARLKTRGNETLPETMKVVIVSANGETTEIGTLTLDCETGEWYSIDGRKLSDKPTKKGIYINNGKKIIKN